MSLSLLKSPDRIPLAPVVALIGPESFIRRKLRNSLVERALAGAIKDMNFSTFDSSEGADKAVQACRDYPCFAARRVVLLREAGELKAKDAEALSSYLEDPQPTTLLIIDSEKLDGRLEWVKKVKKTSEYVEIEPVERPDALSWVREVLREEGKRAEPEVIDTLVDWVGTSLEALKLAVSQCALYVGERPEVKLRDIESLLVKVTDENVFEVVDALFAKDEKALHRSLGVLLDSGEEPLKILSLIHRHLSILLTLKFSGSRKAMGSFRMPPLVWRKYEQQAKAHSRKLSPSLWAPVARADLRLKGSSLPRPLLLKRCVDEIIGLLA